MNDSLSIEIEILDDKTDAALLRNKRKLESFARDASKNAPNLSKGIEDDFRRSEKTIDAFGAKIKSTFSAQNFTGAAAGLGVAGFALSKFIDLGQLAIDAEYC